MFVIFKDQIFKNIRDCLIWVKENVKDEFSEMEPEQSRIEADV